MKKMITVFAIVFYLASIGSVNNLSAQVDDEEINVPTESIDIPEMRTGMGGMKGLMEPGMMRNMKKPGVGAGKMGQRNMFGDEMEWKIIEIIKNNDPEFHKKLNDLKETDPVKYKHIIKISFNLLALSKNLDDKSVEKDIVRGISLEYEIRELGFKYEKASDTDKSKIKQEIKGKLNLLFDIRTKALELRVKKLENEVKELKTNIEKRKANKNQIVEQRLNQVTGNKYLSW